MRSLTIGNVADGSAWFVAWTFSLAAFVSMSARLTSGCHRIGHLWDTKYRQWDLLLPPAHRTDDVRFTVPGDSTRQPIPRVGATPLPHGIVLTLAGLLTTGHSDFTLRNWAGDPFWRCLVALIRGQKWRSQGAPRRLCVSKIFLTESVRKRERTCS